MRSEKAIFVKGNILITTNKFRCKNEVNYGGPADLENVEIYEHDLEIDDNFKYSYFTTFYATGSIVTYHIGDVIIPANCPFHIRDFHQSVEEYRRLLDIKTDMDLLPALRRLIFIGIICAFDVYLCDTFLSIVFSDKNLFINYLRVRGKDSKNKYIEGHIEQEAEIEEEFRDKIVGKTNFQSLSGVTKALFEETLGISFPSTVKMEEYISIRNNLVHRNGKNKKGHQIDISIELIRNLITDSAAIVDTIGTEVRPFWPDIYSDYPSI